MQNTTSTQLTQSVVQHTMDSFLTPVIIPASKLDADQYMAEDLDGVTENLFGSGNLNFLMLQTNQTNELMQAVTPFSIDGDQAGGASAMPGYMSGMPVSAIAGNDFAYEGNGGAGLSSVSGAVVAQAGIAAASSSELPGHVSAVSGGSFDSAYFSSGVSVPVNGTSGTNGLNGASADFAQNGRDGHNGENGFDGRDGGTGGGGDTTVIHNHEHVTVTEIVNLGDVTVNLGDVTIDLGDVIQHITVTVTDITQIVNHITTTITTTITNITDIVHNILDGSAGLTLQLDAILSNITDLDLNIISGDTIFNLIDQVIDLSPVTDLLEPIIDLDGLVIAEVHSIFSLLENGNHQHQPDDTDIGLGVQTMLGDLPLLNGVTDILLNPVEDLVGDIDILADVGLDLFNNAHIDNAAGDTDITLDLGIGVLDGTLLGGGLEIPLDPLESILGDIDLDIGAATNLLGQVAQGIVDGYAGGSDQPNLISTLGDQVSAIADQLLPDLGQSNPVVDLGGTLFNYDSHSGDTDLHIDLGASAIDIPLDALEGLVGDLDVSLDLTDVTGLLHNPLESILGDLDLELNGALDILSVVGQLPGSGGGSCGIIGGDLLAWTESTLSSGSALFSDHLEGGLSGILPAPIGDIAEGIGGLLGGGSESSGGGLFGGHLGGGLFG